MGLFINKGASRANYVRQVRTSQLTLMDELNYTKIADNEFHGRSYFNNDDKDERLRYADYYDKEETS